MHISTLVELLGSKGSDAHLQAWFAQHGIGKPPTTISANQGQIVLRTADGQPVDLTLTTNASLLARTALAGLASAPVPARTCATSRRPWPTTATPTWPRCRTAPSCSSTTA